MNYFFGLYFGNTNMCLAVCKNGKTEVIANSAGDRLTPSFAAYTNGEICVGIAAKQFMRRSTDDVMTCVKDLLNCEDDNCKPKTLEPYDVLVMLFKSMVSIARSYCHETDVPVVITVPLTFSLELQKTVENAALEAGFRVLRLISEPAAAMLAYNLEQDTSVTHNCLIYRLGGTSSDAVVLKVCQGIYQTLAHFHNKEFGGHIFTKRLANFVAGEFQKQYKVDVRESKRSMLKLNTASEACKHSLSIMRSSQCFVESIYDGIDLNVNVSQARFESLIVSELNQTFETISEALKKASLEVNDISKIVLCGGSCKIPKLQQFLTDRFLNCSILTNIPPDETMAIGASKQAALITQANLLTEQDCYITTLTNDICLKKIKDSGFDIITLFNKGAFIPITHQLTLSTANILSLEICENCNGNTDLKVLGKFTLPSAEEVFINVEITTSQKLKLCFTDIKTGLSRHYTI